MGLFNRNKPSDYKQVGQPPIVAETIPANELSELPEIAGEENPSDKTILETIDYLEKLISFLKSKLQ